MYVLLSHFDKRFSKIVLILNVFYIYYQLFGAESYIFDYFWRGFRGS